MRQAAFYIIIVIIFGSLNGLFNMLFGVTALFSPIILLCAILLIVTHPFGKLETIGNITKYFYLFSTSWILVGSISLLYYNGNVSEIIADFVKCFREYSTALLIYTALFLYCIDRTSDELYKIFNKVILLFVLAASVTIFDAAFDIRSNYVAGIVQADRSIGVFANPNETGFQANLTLSMILGMYLHNRIRIFWALVGLAIATSSSILSFSKMAILTSFIIYLIFFSISIHKYFRIGRLHRKGKRLSMIILAFIFFIAVPQFMSYYNNLEWSQKKRIAATVLIVTSGEINAKTTSGRDRAVSDGLIAISKNPLTGFGINSFSRAGNILNISVHNYYLKLLGESGLITLLLFLLFLFYFVYVYMITPNSIWIVASLIILTFMANCVASHNTLGDKFSIGLLAILASFIYCMPKKISVIGNV